MTWVRLKTSDTWHHSPRCYYVHRWLKRGLLRLLDSVKLQVNSARFVSRDKKPTTGESCNSCRTGESAEYR